MSETHEARELRIAAVLDEAEQRLTTWRLAVSLGEPCAEDLGCRFYEWLGEELDADPQSDALLAVAVALYRTGRYTTDSDRILGQVAAMIGDQT